MKHDPLNDALSKINNAEENGKLECEIRPASKIIGRVLRVMQENGYLKRFEYVEDGRGGTYNVILNGNINKCKVVKPRWSVKNTDIENYESRYLPAQGFGVLILTTNRGVMDHSEAKNKGAGGKLLAYVY
ncbi:MAG: 30S ribosomal protein S8 [Candidatus Thermoplasmatota archaeon]